MRNPITMPARTIAMISAIQPGVRLKGGKVGEKAALVSEGEFVVGRPAWLGLEKLALPPNPSVKTATAQSLRKVVHRNGLKRMRRVRSMAGASAWVAEKTIMRALSRRNYGYRSRRVGARPPLLEVAST